jgi:hypothetical protein
VRNKDHTRHIVSWWGEPVGGLLDYRKEIFRPRWLSKLCCDTVRNDGGRLWFRNIRCLHSRPAKSGCGLDGDWSACKTSYWATHAATFES